MRRVLTAIAIAVLVLTATAVPAGAKTALLVLAVKDLPKGWAVNTQAPPNTPNPIGGPCNGPNAAARAETAGSTATAEANLVNSRVGSVIYEVVYGFPTTKQAKAFMETNRAILTSCPASDRVASEMGGSITDADLEMNDVAYIPYAVGMGGYKGAVKMVDVTDEKGKIMTHEDILMVMAKDLLKEKVAAVVWDSVGATQAMAQQAVLTDPKATFGEAFMGKRAKLVGDVASALRTALISKELPSVAIAINHVHQVIGGRGHLTPGGERLKYLAGTRIMMWSAEAFYEDDNDPTSPALGFRVSGQIEKLRFGGRGRKFQFYIVPGYGVHAGVTAMFDSFDLTARLKKAKIDVPYMTAERGARVKLDGKNLGFLKKDLLEYAAEGKRRKFYPFEEVMSRFADDMEKGNIDLEKFDKAEADVQPSSVSEEVEED